jgi:hypothetical protein
MSVHKVDYYIIITLSAIEKNVGTPCAAKFTHFYDAGI